MYERLVLHYTNIDGYDIYVPFYYKGTKKKSAKERAEYDFYKKALITKSDRNHNYVFTFLDSDFHTTDFFKSGNISDYRGPEFMTLDEYFEKNRMKMLEEDEKMLKREKKIAQLTGNQ
jgi:hypothetical protein